MDRTTERYWKLFESSPCDVSPRTIRRFYHYVRAFRQWTRDTIPESFEVWFIQEYMGTPLLNDFRQRGIIRH